jgi:DNA-binding transcriptional regulator YiaG
MTELEDRFNDYVKVRNKMDVLKDDDIKRLQEFIDYQEEVLESRANQIEQLRMALFVEKRKNLVVDKKTVDKLRKKVKECFGTQNKFAEKLGISKSIASKWLNGQEVIPFKRAEQIENITCGAITSNELRTIQ